MSGADTSLPAGLAGPIAVLIPAFNEEESLGGLLDELAVAAAGLDVIVVNDGSTDATSRVAREHGADVLDLPCNLGIGGAVQAGFQHAWEKGYRYLVRCDGDGQHPPSEIAALLTAMHERGDDMIVASRFLSVRSYRSTAFRFLGIQGLAALLTLICSRKVTDPTSGFYIINRKLLYYFSNYYPADYPEPEALALISRQGYSFSEVPIVFRARTGGVSSISSWGTVYYMFKVGLALLIDRVKPVNPLYVSHHLKDEG